MSWTTSGNNQFIAATLYCATVATTGSQGQAARNVKCFTGGGECIYNYIWMPTVAQPFLKIFCPKALDVQSINCEAAAAGEVIFVGRSSYNA